MRDARYMVWTGDAIATMNRIGNACEIVQESETVAIHV